MNRSTKSATAVVTGVVGVWVAGDAALAVTQLAGDDKRTQECDLRGPIVSGAINTGHGAYYPADTGSAPRRHHVAGQRPCPCRTRKGTAMNNKAKTSRAAAGLTRRR